MERVNWGIMGCAGINDTVIPAFKNAANSRLVSIASRSLAKAQEAARRFGIPTTHGSYEDLCRDSGVDAVYIPLPNSLHHEWVIRALRAGKHVLCEKPLALNAEQAEEISKESTATGRLIMEAFMYRFHPQHQFVRDLLQAGEIGEPRLVRASFSFFLDSTKDIRASTELGGGAIMDVGCYCVNVARWIFESEPRAVSFLSHIKSPLGVDWSSTGILDFGDGRFAVVDCSFETMKRNCYEVVGSKGMVVVPEAFNPDPEGATVILRRVGKSPVEKRIGPVDHYTAELEHMSDCILKGINPRISLEDSINNCRVLHSCIQSARHNEWVYL